MAEEKFADRPQILKGDIVRFISALTGEENDDVVRCENAETYYFNPAFGEVLAVYRFDGLNFKCVWESVGYQFDRFKRIIDGINKTQLTLSVKLKSVNEAMEKLAKEAGGTASMVLKKRIKVKPRDMDEGFTGSPQQSAQSVERTYARERKVVHCCFMTSPSPRRFSMWQRGEKLLSSARRADARGASSSSKIPKSRKSND